MPGRGMTAVIIRTYRRTVMPADKTQMTRPVVTSGRKKGARHTHQIPGVPHAVTGVGQSRPDLPGMLLFRTGISEKAERSSTHPARHEFFFLSDMTIP